MHTFKIVTTKEKHGVYFTVIPHQWEDDGVLYWPEHLLHSQREAIRSIAESAPDVSTWLQYDCILKCSNIPSFKDGLLLEKKLFECHDADAEEALIENRNKRRRITVQHSEQTSCKSFRTDRNDVFTSELPDDSTDITIVKHETLTPTVITSSTADSYGEESYHVRPTDDLISSREDAQVAHHCTGSHGNSCINKIMQDIVNLTADVNQIKSSIVEIKNEVKQNRAEYVKIATNLDKIYRIISNQDVQLVTETLNVTHHEQANWLEEYQFPLNSCEEIARLNQEIGLNPELRAQLVQELSKIGGTMGDQDGNKVSYKVIDKVFASEVLMQYTWTGVSRSKTTLQKKPFNALENILSVFFDVLVLADSRHTLKKNEAIFKEGALKHAKKRSLRKSQTQCAGSTHDVNTSNKTEEDGDTIVNGLC